MANVRIGPDGSIIKDDVVIESDGRTVIREDGTIETTSVGGHVPPPNRGAAINTPPVSPLERGGSSVSRPIFSEPSEDDSVVTRNATNVNPRAVKEKEYEIQRLDGRIKNAVPKSMIIATIVLCIVGLLGLYIMFIPAVVTGIIVIVGFSKKSDLEAERERLYEELNSLENGGS